MRAALLHRRARINLALVLLTTLATAIECAVPPASIPHRCRLSGAHCCRRYGLLMPTAWLYLEEQLHATSKVWLGITVAAFSLAVRAAAGHKATPSHTSQPGSDPA